MAGSGDAGTSGAGVMSMRSAQMMGHAKRKSLRKLLMFFLTQSTMSQTLGSCLSLQSVAANRHFNRRCNVIIMVAGSDMG